MYCGDNVFGKVREASNQKYTSKKEVIDIILEDFRELQQMENKEIILNLKFEEVVLRPELVIDKINNFLNVKLTRNDSVNYFNPNMSKKNIGLWKTYKFQKEIDFIYEELKEYCYKG